LDETFFEADGPLLDATQSLLGADALYRTVAASSHDATPE